MKWPKKNTKRLICKFLLILKKGRNKLRGSTKYHILNEIKRAILKHFLHQSSSSNPDD